MEIRVLGDWGQKVHRGKLALFLQEYKYGRFDNPREFLEAIQAECPHQFFQEGLRASELKVDFSPDGVMIREKQNFATRIAGLVLQAVSDNKLRHKALQDFMLANDSVTVTVEVPVYMDSLDVEHMQEELRFKILGAEHQKVRGAWIRLKEFVSSIKPDENYKCNRCKMQMYCKWYPAQSWLYSKAFTSCEPESYKRAGLTKQLLNC